MRQIIGSMLSRPSRYIEGSSGTFYLIGPFLAKNGEIFRIDWDYGKEEFVEYTKIENLTTK